METNNSQWYVKWFKWNCAVLDRFWSRDVPRIYQFQNGTNLCHFFQVLFWGTVVQIASVAAWAFAVFTFLIMPWVLFSALSVIITVGVIVGILAAFIAVVAVAVGIKDAKEWVVLKTQQALNPEPGAAPKFYQVAWQYAVGVKKKFCPTIQFKKDSQS